jgi:hypothetical protein
LAKNVKNGPKAAIHKFSFISEQSIAPKDIASMPAPKLYIPSTLNTDYLLETFKIFLIALRIQA